MKAYERKILLAMADAWDLPEDDRQGAPANTWRFAARQLRKMVESMELYEDKE